MPTHEVTIDMALMKEIKAIVTPHLMAMNEDITARFPDAPDMYLSLAIGWQLAVMLHNLREIPQLQMSAAQGITHVLRHTGFALTPAT